MSAIVNYPDAESKQLDARPQPDETVTEADAADTVKLARLLTRIMRELATLRRRWAPRALTFTNVPFDATGTKKFTFTHRFRGPVNWHIVGWRDASDRPNVIEDDGTDGNALILVSNETGTADVFVEERG